MELDAYVGEHGQSWKRLETLTAQRRLSGPETDELVDLYQQVSTHLSVIRSSVGDPATVSSLSALLLRARVRMAGSRVSVWGSLTSFWSSRFPAALYRLRWWWLGTTFGNVVVAWLMMWWLLQHPSVESALLSPEEIDKLVNEDFEGYYSEFAPSHFAASVWVNNAWVSAQCLALGVLGLPVIWVLFNNILNLSVVGSIMMSHDRGALFWGLILPHGLLELTAVFVAGGVGLRLFWAWVSPGPWTRTQALAREGRTAGTVALGLVGVLAVSGIIEGFVTPSGLPTWARVCIGISAELVFLGYVFVLGANAVTKGEDGDIRADRREAFAPSVD